MTIAERELTVYQRNLVDTCFEEGNYDAAISLMDKLRHEKYRPHASHIRNLVYIALHPPHANEEPDVMNPRLDVMNASPSKMTSKTQQTSFAPTAAHSLAAKRVLNAFARTNTPGSICRALPSYELSANGKGNRTSSLRTDFGDSEISRHSRRIAEAKHCWEILQEDFIEVESSLLQDALPSLTSKNGRTRRATYNDASESEEVVTESPGPLGALARPVLDWLLTVLERDDSSGSDHIQYSPFLLAQIPPSRSTSGSRWDVEVPLDIAFYCLRDPSRSVLGARLLILLVNLTSTTHVDFTMFLNSTCVRMSSLGPEEIQTVFALIPATMACTQFKVALCRTFLTGDNKSKPTRQPKAAPRPTRARQRWTSSEGSAAAPSTTPSETPSASISRDYPVVTALDVVQLVSGNGTTGDGEPSTAARTLQFKFQLLCSFATLQEETHRDQDWQRMVQNGELAQAIDQGFRTSDNNTPEEQTWAHDLKTILAAMGYYHR